MNENNPASCPEDNGKNREDTRAPADPESPEKVVQPVKVCSLCGKPVEGKGGHGLCKKHYNAWYRKELRQRRKARRERPNEPTAPAQFLKPEPITVIDPDCGYVALTLLRANITADRVKMVEEALISMASQHIPVMLNVDQMAAELLLKALINEERRQNT